MNATAEMQWRSPGYSMFSSVRARRRTCPIQVRCSTTSSGNSSDKGGSPPRRRGQSSGRQSGDPQGLSKVESVDSESVDELMEEGNAFEAGIASGFEDSREESNFVRVCLRYWRRCPDWYLQSSLLGSLGTRREVSLSLRFDWVDEPPCRRRTYILPTQQRTLLPDLPGWRLPLRSTTRRCPRSSGNRGGRHRSQSHARYLHVLS